MPRKLQNCISQAAAERRRLAGEEKSNSKAGEEKSNSKAGEEKSNSAAGEEKSNSNTGEEKSESTAGEEKSNSTAGEEKSKSSAGEKKSSWKAGEEKSTSSAGDEESSRKAGEEMSSSVDGPFARIRLRARFTYATCKDVFASAAGVPWCCRMHMLQKLADGRELWKLDDGRELGDGKLWGTEHLQKMKRNYPEDHIHEGMRKLREARDA